MLAHKRIDYKSLLKESEERRRRVLTDVGLDYEDFRGMFVFREYFNKAQNTESIREKAKCLEEIVSVPNMKRRGITIWEDEHFIVYDSCKIEVKGCGVEETEEGVLFYGVGSKIFKNVMLPEKAYIVKKNYTLTATLYDVNKDKDFLAMNNSPREFINSRVSYMKIDHPMTLFVEMGEEMSWELMLERF